MYFPKTLRYSTLHFITHISPLSTSQLDPTLLSAVLPMIRFTPSSLRDILRASHATPQQRTSIPPTQSICDATSSMTDQSSAASLPPPPPLIIFHVPTTQLNAPFIADDSYDTLHPQAAIHHHFIARPSIPSEPQGPPSNPASSHGIIIPV